MQRHEYWIHQVPSTQKKNIKHMLQLFWNVVKSVWNSFRRSYLFHPHLRTPAYAQFWAANRQISLKVCKSRPNPFVPLTFKCRIRLLDRKISALTE
jgi:hypothetical protein